MTLELVPWRGAKVPLLSQGEISRYTTADYINWITSSQGYMGPPMPVTTYGSRPVEPISNSFEGFVYGMLYVDGPVAAVEAYRLRVFGQAPLLYQEIVDGRAGDLFDDPALDRLRTPWAGATLSDLMKRALIYGDFAGNAFIVDLEDELVLIRPDWVEIILEKRMYRGQQLGWRQLGIIYYEGGRGRGDGVPFLPGEYAHFIPGLPDPLASYRGMAWLTPLVRDIQADKAATDHKVAFFENSASPNLAVSLPKEITPTQFNEFVELMDAKHKGPQNAGKTLYTGGGADVTVIGANMQQQDFSSVVGKGETRVANAGGVSPVLLSFSEGMQGSSLNAGNYTPAKRNFVDTTMRDLWANFAGSIGQMDAFRAPREHSRLWYDGRDIPFLHEDAKDLAEIQQTRASTLSSYVTNGWKPESALKAVAHDDITLLEHSGAFSVQLQPPGAGSQMAPDANGNGMADDTTAGNAPAPDFGALRTEFWDVEDDDVLRAVEDLFDVGEDDLERARYDVRVAAGHVGGGRFRKLSDVAAALLADWAKGDGPDDPLGEHFDRPQLMTILAEERKKALAAGDHERVARLTPRRGATPDQLKTALYEDVRGAVRQQRDAPKPSAKFTLQHAHAGADVAVYKNRAGQVALYQESDAGVRAAHPLEHFDSLDALHAWATEHHETRLADWAAGEKGGKAPTERRPSADAIAGDPFQPDTSAHRPLGPAVGSADSPRHDFSVTSGVDEKLAQAYGSTRGGQAHKSDAKKAETFQGGYAQRVADLGGDHGGKPEVTSLPGGISAKVDLLTYPDGKRVVRKDYGQGTAGTLSADVEELSASVLDAFGVPAPAVRRVDAHTIDMEFVDGTQGGATGVLSAPASIRDSAMGRRLGLADAVMGHRDRNGGGWMRVDGGIVAVDNGNAFEHGDRAAHGNPFASYLMSGSGWASSTDVDPAELAKIRAKLVELGPEFNRLGRGRFHQEMLTRLDSISTHAKTPHLGSEPGPLARERAALAAGLAPDEAQLFAVSHRPLSDLPTKAPAKAAPAPRGKRMSSEDVFHDSALGDPGTPVALARKDGIDYRLVISERGGYDLEEHGPSGWKSMGERFTKPERLPDMDWRRPPAAPAKAARKAAPRKATPKAPNLDGLDAMDESALRKYAPEWEVNPAGKNPAQLRRELRAKGAKSPAVLREEQALATPGGIPPGDPDYATPALERQGLHVAVHSRPAIPTAADEVPGSRVSQAQDRIRAAVDAVLARNGRQPGEWAGLADVRAELGTDFTPEEVDKALVLLNRQPNIRVVPESNQKMLSQRDWDASVIIGNEHRMAIAITPPAKETAPARVAKAAPVKKAAPRVASRGNPVSAADTRARLVAALPDQRRALLDQLNLNQTQARRLAAELGVKGTSKLGTSEVLDRIVGHFEPPAPFDRARADAIKKATGASPAVAKMARAKAPVRSVAETLAALKSGAPGEPLAGMNKAQLLTVARELGVSGASGMRVADLRAAIAEAARRR